MHVASVTLSEVLRAAAGRAAALVPETAGYLALAIGDASARLPYRIEDDLVTLTTEGTVRVARGKVTVTPEEGARVLRDHLRRLLSVSAGTMPGLAQAGTPRLERAGPEAVIAEIEAALIPVNRAAARRSLARLARDASRAKDAGRLAASVPPAAPSGEPRPIQQPVAASPAATPMADPPAALPAAPPLPPSVGPVAVAAPRHEEVAFEVIVDVEPETPAQVFVPIVATVAPTPWTAPEEPTHRITLPIAQESPRAAWVEAPQATGSGAPFASDHGGVADTPADFPPAEATILDPAVIFSEIDPGQTPRLGTPAPLAVLAAPPPEPAPVTAPSTTPSAAVDAAAFALDARLRAGALSGAVAAARQPPPRQRRPPWQAELRSTTPSDVDDLLASFRPSSPSEESTRMRRDLKRLVGIDATQLPPRVSARTGST